MKDVNNVRRMIFFLVAVMALCMPVSAAEPDIEYDYGGDLAGGFDTESQLDALGRDELMQSVPEDARELLEETGLYDMSVKSMLQLSPGDFFKALWAALLHQLKSPVRTLGALVGIILLCAFLNGLKTASWDTSLSGIFGTVSVLCIVLSVAAPIIDCIMQTTKAIRDASYFMISFVPVFSAALVAAGQPVTGATYNLFLFSTCQVIAQVVAQTLVPLMSVYLALCIVGALVPEVNISSAANTIKTVVTWALGFIFTLFVGLLSVQTMVSTGADSVTTKTAKFLIGSFVPVVGSALSEAYTAAQGCLRLIKTSVGAYGIIVALFTFLPVFMKALIWYLITNIGVVAGDIIGVPAVSSVLKACSTVLGILLAIILCYALLLIVSTTVVLVTGAGA
ncbi:MAG: stage III sporulation protein AE [Oscillospiraceae bacterium]|jgi:stage III sporulation protein AE|nr:stage III sporulation protein AE [Oscillospiraceae bacterium]